MKRLNSLFCSVAYSVLEQPIRTRNGRVLEMPDGGAYGEHARRPAIRHSMWLRLKAMTASSATASSPALNTLWYSGHREPPAVAHLNPVTFRQTNHCQFRRDHQQFANTLLAGLALMTFRQGVSEVRINLQRNRSSASKPFDRRSAYRWSCG